MANLRLPGPTPVPPDVYEAMSKQMIDHRGVEFAEMLRRTTANLKRAFQTENDLYVLTSSGTGAMEAAVVNTLSPGERVLGVTIGNFGDRFLKIASAYGASVNEPEVPGRRRGGPGADTAGAEGRPGRDGGAGDAQRDVHRHHERPGDHRGHREGGVRQDGARGRDLVARPPSGSRWTSGVWTWWWRARRRGGCARRGSR